MKTGLTKLAVFSFIMLAIMAAAGNHLNSVYDLIGDPKKIESFLKSLFLVTGVGSLGLLIIRSLMGIVLILIVIVILLFLLRTGRLAVLHL
jgi:hypothetical protein